VPTEALKTPKTSETVNRWHPSQWQLWSYPTRPSFRNDIQGLRAIAVLYTIFFHFGIARYSTGIDIFIVISGFAITRVLLRSRLQRGQVLFDLKGFYARRVRRILPVSTLLLLITIVAAYIWLGPLGGASDVATDAKWSAIFLENWHAVSQSTDYFADIQTPSLLLHYWSLGFDEQFYVVYPLILIGIMSWTPERIRRKVLAGTLLVVVASSAIWAIIQTNSDPLVAYLSTYTRIWEIGLGALLALVPEEVAFKSEKINALIGWVSLLTLFFAGYFIYADGLPWPNALYPCLGTLGIIWTGRRSGKWGPNAFLMLKPVVYVGNMSYSLYLWNYLWLFLPLRFALPGVTMATQAVAPRLLQVAAGFLCAVITYHVIEWPLRESTLLERKLWLNIPIGFGMIGIVFVVAWLCESFWPL